LADFGTNTEIALWDGQILWATSVPGAPAFEGIGLRNGLMAETGAIYKVKKQEDSIHYQTIGGEPPRGYCASGFIDAIALLVDNKQLKVSGRFANPLPSTGYRLDSAYARTAIFASDIDVFQRAKASTAAAMAQLFAFSGLEAQDLHRLWLCGSFGEHLDLENSMRLGLLPNIAPDRVRVLANASLAGCEKLLLNPVSEARCIDIVRRARVFNLSNIQEYEERFIDNLRLTPMHLAERF
jgi:uncharacterized 2Fe-2S/4Fe-4S cluster protein (DUF4445 family)